MISKIGSILMVYFFYLYISRVYGAETHGIFTTFLTLLTLLSVLTKMGFDTSIVKRIASYKASDTKGKITPTHRKISIIVLITSLLVSTLIYFFNEQINLLFFEKSSTFDFIWLSIALPFFSLYAINMESLRGLKKMNSFALLQNISLFFIALLALIFLFNNGETTDPIYSFSISTILIFILSFFLFKKHSPESSITFISSKGLLKESFPMLLSNSSFYLMTLIDILMISYFLPESETGIYANAMKIANLNIVFLFAINSIAAPKLAEFNATNDLGSLKTFTKETSRLSILLSIPIFVITLIFPEFLLGLFGDEFIAGKQVLIILGIGQFFNALAGSVISVLNMTGQEKTAKNIIVSSTIINLILNLILIPKLGILGAGIATGVTTILWNGLGIWFVYKKYNFISITLPWQKM